MAALEMRPRFAVDTHCDTETVVAALRDCARQADPTLEGTFGSAHCVLRIPLARRFLWSTELDLTFHPLPSEGGEPSPGIRIRCLFTPRPSVWTGFAFVYPILAVTGFAGALYGVAQLALDRTPWAFAVAPAAIVLIAGVYGATFIGQGLAASQMYQLRRCLDASMKRAEARDRLTPKTPFDSARL
jgi:hypothetical protein